MTWWSKYLLLAKGGSDVLLSARNGMTNTGKRRSLKPTFVRNTVGFCLGYFENDNAGAVLRTIKLAENVKPIEGARYNVSDIDTAATQMFETFADGSAIPDESMFYRGQASAMNWCNRIPQNLHADPGNVYITASTVEDPTSPTGYATSAVVTPDSDDAWWGSLNIHVWNVFENYFTADTTIYVPVWAKGDGVNTLELEDLAYNTASNTLVAVYCNGESIATSTTITPTTEWKLYEFKFNFSATDYNNARIGYRFKPCVTDQTEGIIKITGVNITDVPFAATSTVPNLMTAKTDLRVSIGTLTDLTDFTIRAIIKKPVIINRSHGVVEGGGFYSRSNFNGAAYRVMLLEQGLTPYVWKVANILFNSADESYISIRITPTKGYVYSNGQLVYEYDRDGSCAFSLDSTLILFHDSSQADEGFGREVQILKHSSDDATELAWTGQGGN